MKILRKENEFKKMPDNTVQEVLVIKHLLGQGWNYCKKETYKDFFKSEVKVKVKEVKETEDSVTKATKGGNKKKSNRK